MKCQNKKGTRRWGKQVPGSLNTFEPREDKMPWHGDRLGDDIIRLGSKHPNFNSLACIFANTYHNALTRSPNQVTASVRLLDQTLPRSDPATENFAHGPPGTRRTSARSPGQNQTRPSHRKKGCDAYSRIYKFSYTTLEGGLLPGLSPTNLRVFPQVPNHNDC